MTTVDERMEFSVVHQREQMEDENERGDDTPAHYGDLLTRCKEDDDLLCVFANINGLPRTVNQPKERALQKLITDYNIDVMGCSEVNLNWSKLPPREQWAERSSGWWENSITSMAWNREDEATSSSQPGGCLQMVKDKAATSWTESGNDETGLGRWTWTRHKGKNNITVKIYTAYRTCVPHNKLGESTVHRQHLRYLHRHHDDRTPRQALLEDLGAD